MYCLKLSPNLRKPTKEYKAALLSENSKTAWSCEVQQLKSILAMVQDPEDQARELDIDDQDDIM